MIGPIFHHKKIAETQILLIKTHQNYEKKRLPGCNLAGACY